MSLKKNVTDYWFTIEPYVFVGITKQLVLLYNTLDGRVLESDQVEVIKLLRETLQKDNCGVILLTNNRYNQSEIKTFINQLREKFMGDIIDISLSKKKPVQLLPYYNYLDKNIMFKDHYTTNHKYVLENLSEISLHLDSTTNIRQLISFLHSIPEIAVCNITGNIGSIANYSELLSFLDQYTSDKYIHCSYKNVITLQTAFENNFTYRISVDFPLEMEFWESTRQNLLNQSLPIEYVFDVASDEDCLQAEQLIEQFQIEKYQFNPVYTENNIQFFKENVFLSKEDILSTPISIKDIFIRQSMNIYDFGKINIMPNGDAYANINHSILGNIYTHSIYEIVQKEVDEGKSWFRVRDQEPCNTCIYQWLCPSPSSYEIVTGRANLCHVKN